jgi:hypothetical protein
LFKCEEKADAKSGTPDLASISGIRHEMLEP